MFKNFLFSGLFLATPLAAQDTPQSCINIAQDAERLACYDAQFQPDTLAQSDENDDVTPPPNWNVEIETSSIDDSTSVFLTTYSDEPLNCGYGTKRTARLTIRCMENTTSFVINTACHMASGHNNYGNVTMRIDDNQAFTRDFRESTNNRALGLWNGGSSIPVIRRVLEGDRLIARFTPFGENPQEPVFDVSRLTEVIGPLQEACNWN